jgi:3-oxoacyl-[acyl-carrier-protein] synthase-3
MMPFSRIISTGSFLPTQRLTNTDLVQQLAAKGIETSHDWIVERTGIQARHFAQPHESCSELALQAAKNALAFAKIDAQSIDLIIVATSTPDMVFPSTAAILQGKLGITNHCAAFDVQAVCSGFVYALSVADSLIRTGAAHRALVVGSEVFSRLLDFTDRTTCVLFGDGAGAVILEASDTPGIHATQIHANGQHAGILCVPSTIASGVLTGNPFLHMDGQAVFKLAVGVLADVAQETLIKAGLGSQPIPREHIDFLIPHQANIRIMQSTAKKLGLSPEQTIVTVDQHGNTSAASIPLALDHAVRSGRILKGHRLMLEGVGGGFTWGAAYLTF